MSVYIYVCTILTQEAVAAAFGKVLEVEDGTDDKEQTHIGRVLVLSSSDLLINESITRMVDGHGFSVRATEDVAEIIDFCPHYEFDNSSSVLSADEGSGCGDGQNGSLPDDSEVEETPPGSLGEAKRSRQLSSRQLEIVEALITSRQPESDELEEGEILANSKISEIGPGPESEGVGPTLKSDVPILEGQKQADFLPQLFLSPRRLYLLIA